MPLLERTRVEVYLPDLPSSEYQNLLRSFEEEFTYAFGGAIELIESKPLLFERSAELSWNLGWAYFKLEDWKAAQTHLSRARDLEPGKASSWWALSVAQMEDGLLEEAERNVKEALRLRDTSNFRGTLALILMQRGKLGEAEQVHLKGIELKPESAERWESYACFLDDCGRQSEAEVAYKKARALRSN